MSTDEAGQATMATLKQSLTHRLVVMHHRSPVEQVPLRHRDPPPPPFAQSDSSGTQVQPIPPGAT